MFFRLCKSILHWSNGCKVSAQNPSMVFSFSLRFLSIDANQNSSAVSYLIKSTALSSKSAISVSKHVQLENAENPDLVISYLQNLGFSRTQISHIISKLPRILLSNPDISISPKVEFFRSKGSSNSDFVKIISSYPWLLTGSVENKFIPNFKILRSFFESDEKTILTIKRSASIMYRRLETDMLPNIKILRENGVAEASILFLIHCHAQKLVMDVKKFKKIVDEVKKIGLDPSNKSQFSVAIVALSAINKTKWDEKMNAYMNWGWSNEDVMTAFRKFAWCMTLSTEKINAIMDFFVNNLGLDSSVIVSRPWLLSRSLKKNLLPRASVIQFLSSKGLIKVDSSITKLFVITEKMFIEKYVNCYDEAPLLLKLYNDKLLDLSK